MTGAEKVLKWYNEYFKMNKIAPTEREIKWQIEMAIDEENSILKAQTPIGSEPHSISVLNDL
jgi:hypothetical protein